LRRLLLDQGLPRSTATLLRQAGWDVLHVSEIGMSRADDQDILAHARLQSRVCVTLDADFHTLIATRGAHSPSVIRVRREGLDAPALAALLQTIWTSIEQPIADGSLVTVTETSVRVRRLPILRP
jgi:predicted nuclease of predicted toxin-antitoxin system